MNAPISTLPAHADPDTSTRPPRAEVPLPRRPFWLHTRQRAKMARDRIGRFGLCLVRGKFHSGHCPICQKKTLFVRNGPWLREHCFCVRCLSVPRFRALIRVLDRLFPNWRQMAIHESSPGGASSNKLARECCHYIGTQYFLDAPSGSQFRGWRCENLEALCFDDESHDLVITQDVLEHVLRPDRAFAEIARTLKPGGAHVFTVPIYPRRETLVRALPGPHGIEYLCEPNYHGNPVDKNGSLVVREWGYDLPDYIAHHSGLHTMIYHIRDRRLDSTATSWRYASIAKPCRPSSRATRQKPGPIPPHEPPWT